MKDADNIFRWENDQTYWDVSGTQRPFSHFCIEDYVMTSQNEDIYTAKQLRLIIEDGNKDLAVGCVDLYEFEPQNLRAGIGIFIDNEQRKQGYGLKALELLITYASNVLHIHNLYAFVSQDNEASQQLFVKSGFNRTAVLQDWILRGQNFKNIIVYQHLTR